MPAILIALLSNTIIELGKHFYGKTIDKTIDKIVNDVVEDYRLHQLHNEKKSPPKLRLITNNKE